MSGVRSNPTRSVNKSVSAFAKTEAIYRIPGESRDPPLCCPELGERSQCLTKTVKSFRRPNHGPPASPTDQVRGLKANGEVIR
jgi:hypothetical protein